MIIPIRCMNCGNILADKWVFYKKEVGKLRENNGPIYMDVKSTAKEKQEDTAELKVLKHLGLNRYCCRKHMLTHVDLIDKI